MSNPTVEKKPRPVSHGRGGFSNIYPDPTEITYTDANITQNGVYGISDKPSYSAGRGGAGNISVAHDTQAVGAESTMEVPTLSTRDSTSGPKTIGRGGVGNIIQQVKAKVGQVLNKSEDEITPEQGKQGEVVSVETKDSEDMRRNSRESS